MKKKLLIALTVLIILTLGFLLVKKQFFSPTVTHITEEHSSYIAAFTSGIISTHESVQVVLASDVVDSDLVGKEADSRLFRISPSVRGALTWYNERTLEFRPNNPLDSDKEYMASIALGRLYEGIPGEFETFTFEFRTIRQDMEVNISGLEFYSDASREHRRVGGEVVTADYADPAEVAKTVKAQQGGSNLEVSWGTSETSRTHQFWVEGVTQSDNLESISIILNGKAISADLSETIEVEISAKGDFRVLTHHVSQSPEQYLEIRFSEPLDPTQNLQGLIHASGVREIRTIIESNIVRVYPSTRLTGSYSFEVSEGVRSVSRQRLQSVSSISVVFEVIKPQVRLAGSGVIIPSKGDLLFPFQAVSLRAVDISIVRVFEQNIAQFLQVNTLSGQTELRRVGRMVLRRTIPLNQFGAVNLNSWNTYHIDLSKMIDAEPGAIYQVTVDFRKEYSTYSCNGTETDEPLEIIDETYNPDDDRTTHHYSYHYYDWRERDNPCHEAYYNNRSVTRNVLASNLGMVAKSGADGSFTIIVTDLNTAKPLTGINVNLLNYQQQTIATASTESNGLATFTLNEQQKPYLAVAKSGQQRGYLKVDAGSALSLSSFDVSGVSVQRGLKGFIYGERGVWRPGDTLFVTFILEDKGSTIPGNHPVTFELTDPRGREMYRTVANKSVSGMYSFPVPTSSEAITGSYTAMVRVGGASFSQTLRVETIMPNRLKINLTLDDDALHYGKSSTARLESSWLHGAPARNLRVKLDAILSESTTSFSNYPGFSFDDPARTFQSQEQNVFEGQLDNNGRVTFSPKISVKSSAPGKLQAHFTARVFEEGGAFSIDRFSMPYYPYETFVGIKLPEPQGSRGAYLTDTLQTVRVVSVNSDGKPAANTRVNVEVYKIDWRWWWERSDENLSRYISSSHRRPIQRKSITTNSKGEGTFNLRLNHPEWGRFLIRVADATGGHAAGTIAYFDWPGWVSRDRRTTPEAASMLAFTSDKEEYNVGEKVHVTIPSPQKGQIFLTIENGVKVLESHWVEAQKGETTFTFNATNEMSPNVFVNAMLIQPHGQTTNDLPLRLYGIVPISVEDPQTHLRPVIKMPDVLAPEEKVTISVSEENGSPMAFTLAVVDDGLLDLTRFRTPSPWNSFYAREALGVKTWDLFDFVVGATTAQMQRIISIGGDEDLDGKGDQTANRFKPVVRYFGPYEIRRRGEQKISFTMPNYVGSVRVMAVAAKEGTYGSSEKTVPVRKPLMVLGTLPRVLGPEEEVVLPISVFAMEGHVKNVNVRIETNDLLTVSGRNQQTLKFDDIGDQVVRFNLKVASKLGVGRVKIVAESGRESATHEIELNVRNPNPPMTLVQDTVLRRGESWGTSYRAFGIEGTNTASIELSTLPPINLGKRLKFLLGYPHGCLEQTVSKAFPQLFISRLAEVEDNVKRSAEDNVRAALDRMRHFRTGDGGLSLWPGGSYPDDWGSLYAGHFMLEAQKLGYSVSPATLDGWKRSTQRVARLWSPTTQQGYRNSDLMQAYRLYTLALANSPDIGAMNRLREVGNLSVAAKWRLAAAYVLVGNPETARAIVNGIPLTVGSYREQSFTYGSDIRDKAMIVETLTLMGDLEKSMPLLRDLSEQLSSNRWMSTQETSFSLLAFSKFAERNKASNAIDAEVSIHGQSGKRQRTNQSFLQHTFNPVQRGDGRVEVKNNGDGVLYARIANHGVPVGGEEVEQSNNLSMDVNFKLMNGVSISPDRITQGTDFYADIRVYNSGSHGDLEQLILSFIVPSGWEIRTSRLDEGQRSLRSSPYDYQDVRDDRVYTYFSLPRGESKSFRLRFNAAYEGKYYMPGVMCEAMYDNSIVARRKGGWVFVTQ